VTYILDGHMLHEDHLGNKGNLKSGGVQWMTAGRGIIHSEMPQQDRGRMRGFQLWINLPAKDKMKPAATATWRLRHPGGEARGKRQGARDRR
jgi:redox-sensitive bicupin YhaK (pirin superfamily)